MKPILSFLILLVMGLIAFWFTVTGLMAIITGEYLWAPLVIPGVYVGYLLCKGFIEETDDEVCNWLDSSCIYKG